MEHIVRNNQRHKIFILHYEEKSKEKEEGENNEHLGWRIPETGM